MPRRRGHQARVSTLLVRVSEGREGIVAYDPNLHHRIGGDNLCSIVVDLEVHDLRKG